VKDKENDIEEMADELTKELLKANYNKIKDAISEAFSMLDQNEVSSEESKRRVKEMLMEVEREVERLMSSLAYTGSPALRNAVLEFCKQSNDKDRENAIDDVSTVFEEIVKLRTDPIMERLYSYVKKSGQLRDVYWLVNFAINPMEVAITILSDYETVDK